MPGRRLRTIQEPVSLTVDGHGLTAERGEPVAISIAASGRNLLSRSVKYHRPRGAACYRGRCDGCLMRVNGVPNVMTCLIPAEEGLVVETQNVLGSATHDWLALNDWFFPEGFDHHHFMTQPAFLNRWMMAMARRIAGVGKLPDRETAALAVEDHEVDVLVVGAGPSGRSIAESCATEDFNVLLVDERIQPDRVPSTPYVLWWQHSVVGAYEGVFLGIGQERISKIRPKRLVLAMGAHEFLVPSLGSDLPGVLGKRAASLLLSRHVLLGSNLVWIGNQSLTPQYQEPFRKAGANIVVTLMQEQVEKFCGGTNVEEVWAQVEGETKRFKCDAVIVESPLCGDFELAAQLGIDVAWDKEGFVIQASAQDGSTSIPWVRCVGECTGLMRKADILSQTEAAAEALVMELQHV